MNYYPKGKMRSDDDGAVAVAIGIDQGRVVIDFGKSLAWIAFDKVSLRGLIDLLEEKYKLL